MKEEFALKKGKALIIGASGMAGQAFTKELLMNGYHPLGLSRGGPDIFMDATKEDKHLQEHILRLRPGLIINCAAIVSHLECEKNPKQAYAVNTHIPEIIAECTAKCGSKFIQISTDHYYSGDKDSLHSEDHPLTILNYYAETKREGELNALKNPESLIIRTNITGIRGDISRQTFAEWLIDCIEKRKHMNLFTDFYTSTLDTSNFAKIVLNQQILDSYGVMNIASSTVSNKKAFAISLAKRLGFDLDWSQDASVKSLNIPRAESLGLDCTRAESIIGSAMPDLSNVCHSIALQRAQS